MKKSKIIITILAVVTGTAVGLAITYSGIDLKNETTAPGAHSFYPKSTGTMDSGDALVELTPTVGEGRVVVYFNMNTHSVNLNRFDLKEITVLEYAGGSIKPAEADRIGGHHSSGTIVFDTGKDIGGFTMRIKGIPRVDERTYTWNAG